MKGLKRARKLSTTRKQARAYRRRRAKDIEREPERVYGKTSAASSGRHICPACMVAIDGDACACGHVVPPQPNRLEKTTAKAPPVDHLRLSNPADRRTAEKIADAMLPDKGGRGLDRISERHRPARKQHL